MEALRYSCGIIICCGGEYVEGGLTYKGTSFGDLPNCRNWSVVCFSPFPVLKQRNLLTSRVHWRQFPIYIFWFEQNNTEEQSTSSPFTELRPSTPLLFMDSSPENKWEQDCGAENGIGRKVQVPQCLTSAFIEMCYF